MYPPTGPVIPIGSRVRPRKRPGHQGGERAEPAPGVGGHTGTGVRVTRRSWKSGSTGYASIRARGGDVVAEAQPEQLPPGAAPPQRALPVVAVAADQVEGRDRRVVEPAARRRCRPARRPPAGRPRRRRPARSAPSRPAQTISDAPPAVERLAGLLRREREIGGARRVDRRRALAGEERPGAVAGGHDQRLAPHRRLGHLQRTVPQVEARESARPAAPRRAARRAADGLRQPQRLLGGGHRDQRPRPVVERGAHGRGGAEDVDHEDRPALDLLRGEAGRGEDDVELHASGRSRCDSRSRNRVSTLPGDEVGVADDPGEERDRGGDAFQDEAVERLAHPGQRLFPVVPVHDHLGQQRVVVGRHACSRRRRGCPPGRRARPADGTP